MRQKFSLHNRQTGFTLLEILVALFITAMVLGLVSGSLMVTVQANRRAVEQMELLQKLRETLNRMTTQLSATALSRHRPELSPFTTYDIDSMSQPYDALTFNTLAYKSHRPDAHEPDFISMTYFTEEDRNNIGPEGTRALMHRIGGSINDNFEVEGGIVYPMVYGVTRFQLDYLEPEGEWRHEWIVTDRAMTLPCAIRVKLGIKSENVDEMTMTAVIPLVMTTNTCQFERDTILKEF